MPKIRFYCAVGEKTMFIEKIIEGAFIQMNKKGCLLLQSLIRIQLTVWA